MADPNNQPQKPESKVSAEITLTIFKKDVSFSLDDFRKSPKVFDARGKEISIDLSEVTDFFSKEFGDGKILDEIRGIIKDARLSISEAYISTVNDFSVSIKLEGNSKESGVFNFKELEGIVELKSLAFKINRIPVPVISSIQNAATLKEAIQIDDTILIGGTGFLDFTSIKINDKEIIKTDVIQQSTTNNFITLKLPDGLVGSSPLEITLVDRNGNKIPQKVNPTLLAKT